MTAMAVWAFAGPDTARRAETDLGGVTLAGGVGVLDGAVVSWREGRRSPRGRQLQNVALTRELGSGFWGLLIGVVCFGPVLATLGGWPQIEIGRLLSGVGLDADRIDEVRRCLRPGASALFVIIAQDADLDSVRERLGRPEDLAVWFTEEENRALREVFVA